jgi:hypothetical protein
MPDATTRKVQSVKSGVFRQIYLFLFSLWEKEYLPYQISLLADSEFHFCSASSG